MPRKATHTEVAQTPNEPEPAAEEERGGLAEAVSGDSQPQPVVTLSPLPPSVQSNATIVTEKLDAVLWYLNKMNKRDKLRTWGGFVKSVIGLSPVIVLLWSVWYFSQHGAEFMKQLSDQAVRSAAEYNQKSVTEQLNKVINQMKK